MPNKSNGVLPGLLRRARAIKQPPARMIEVTKPIDLEPVSQSPKQQMAGQMRRWSPAKQGMPTTAQLNDIEIAQPRNLDIKGCAVRQCRTDPYAGHRDQAARWVLTLVLSSLAI